MTIYLLSKTINPPGVCYGSVYVPLHVFFKFSICRLLILEKSTLILEKSTLKVGKIDFKLGKIDFMLDMFI